MHFFILPKKDTTIFESKNTLNAGLDQVLDIDKAVNLQQGTSDPNVTVTSSVSSRILIKFDLTELSASILSGSVTASSVYLNMFAVEGKEIPLSYSIFAHPISQSWDMGTGHKDDFPIVKNGASWLTKDGLTDWIPSGSIIATGSATGSNGDSVSGSGATWFTTSAASQSFDFQTTDLHLDVTSIVHLWLSGSSQELDSSVSTEGLENEGFIIKRSNSDEIDEKLFGSLSFYSNETHTVYRPRLEVVWDDQIYNEATTSTTLFTTSSATASVDVTLAVVTASSATGGLGDGYTSSISGPATGTFVFTFASFSSGKQFELTSSIETHGAIHAAPQLLVYSSSDDINLPDTASEGIFFFATASDGGSDADSLSGSIENLVLEINQSTGSVFVTASLSGSNALVLSASRSGSDGNLITFSGSTATLLAGGSNLYTSASNAFFTSAIFEFTESAGVYTSCSLGSGSVYISGSVTFVTFSVVTCSFTQSLGSGFQPYDGTPSTNRSMSIGTSSEFSSYSLDQETGIFLSQSFTNTTQSFDYTSASISESTSESFDLRQLDLASDPVLTITNLKEEYIRDTTVRFELFARERFPTKEFVTGSWAYTRDHRILPSSSFYSIRDAYTEEEIVPFSNNSRISLVSGSHYFNLLLPGYEPERFYRILLKVEKDGIENTFDKDYIFKIIR